MASLISAIDKFREKTSPVGITLRGRKWKMIDTLGKNNAKGPVLIMLPGTLGNADIFFNQINKLGKRIRIIAMAYPLITDVDLIAGDIASLLDRMGVEKASILGSSYGGFVAQIFAQNHPTRVDTLFIGNSLTDIDLVRPAFPPIKQLMKTPPKDLRKHISGQMAGWAEPEKIFAEVKAFLQRELAEYLPPRGPKMRLAAIFLRKKAPVPAIPDKQIVVIDCEDDPLIPTAVRKDIRKRHRKAEQHRLPSGGHFPYLTRSSVYNKILEDRLLS
ncbi:MAG: alpha/beta hydrolase [Alphaproteobacteria bacterium]|jgi:maspardin|nr:alpha/beta hydrolase [Alphaproteobacteria bacterium]MBT4085876.1 alpha/beta hydrolase [Alphaproteobacteria bacterium]MBT4542651.1 alpha/beta hydrolase [Alphaproteobacteria bacterium]MBT6384861.1 alpha/beta hydrolase [Alphaproteobacteria bacterium]MBT7746953.1 alpha/beta hydrolase [Alphaproteobacteria bacterium]